MTEAPTPKGDSILLEVLESDLQTEVLTDHLGRGITYVSSTGDRHIKRARVVAVGPGRRHPKTDARLPMMVEPGDVVYYRDWLTRWHSGDGLWPGPGDLALVQQETRVADTGKVMKGEDRFAIVAIAEDEQARVSWPREHGEQVQLPASYFDADAARGRA